MAIGVHMETNPSALGPVTQDGEEKTEGERGTQREMNGNGTRAVPLMHRLPSRLRLHLLDRLLLQLGNLLGRGHALVAICLYLFIGCDLLEKCSIVFEEIAHV